MLRLLREYQFLAALTIAVFLWTAWQLRAIIAVAFAGYIVASALLPAIDRLDRRMPRVLAVLAAFAAAAACAGLIVFAIAGPVAAAWSDIRGTFLAHPPDLGFLHALDIDLGAVARWLQSRAASAAATTLSSAALAFTAVIIGIYLSYDWHRVREWIAETFRTSALVRALIDRQREELGAWARGQIALSFAVGILAYVALALIGVPFAPALALAAGLFELIPYAGPILSAIPAILIAYEGGLEPALFVAGAYILIQQLENHALVPLIMQRAVYIHPVVIIIAILVGFETMGIVGALLAVPFVTLLWTSYRTWRERQNPG